MKHFFTLLTFFITLSVFSQGFYKATIVYADGKTAEGFAKLPSNQTLSGSVKFRAGEKGKVTTINDDDVSYITYFTKKGNQFTFERTGVRTLNKSFGKVYDKVVGKKKWLLMLYSNPIINYYYEAKSYSIDKDGNMISKTSDSSGTWADIGLLFKRPGEEGPATLGTLSFGAKVLNKESLFRKTAILYFEGDKDFIKRIDDKEFKSDEMLDMAKAYILHKGGKVDSN